MKPNLNNHKKRHGTFMYTGQTGFKFRSSFTKGAAPRTATAILLSLTLFVALAGVNVWLAVVMATAMFAFQMLFASEKGLVGVGTPEEEKALKEKEQSELLEKVKTAAFAAGKDSLDKQKAEFELKMDEAKKDVEELKKNLATQEAEFKAFKEKGGELTPFGKAIASQIREQITKKGAEFEDFKRNKNAKVEIELDMKAAANMMVSTSVGGSAYIPAPYIRPGYVDLVRNKPLIEQFANGGAISSPVVVTVNKTNPQGTAAITAEGNAMPLISTEISSETVTAKLLGEYLTISIQMLGQIDFMAALIEQELMYKLAIAADNQLLSGTGVGDNLKGIETYSSTYILTSINTTNPNNFDCIRAIIAQEKSLNFDAAIIVVHPIDGANMELVKDTYGRPIAKEYMDADGRLFRVPLIESNQIAQGYVGVFDISKFFVWDYEPVKVQYGWINDNLIKNMITVTATRQLIAYVSANHVNGFVWDTFANVKAALAPTP